MRHYQSVNPNGHRHLWFTSPRGQRVLYAYIRKNGCSSIKRFLGGHPDSKISAFEKHFHRGQPYDLSFFIYRDPIDRVVSLYRDKVLDGRGANDILEDFYELMPNENPSDFDAFAHFVTISDDPHCWSQASHLRKMRYCAIPLKKMYKLNELLGAPNHFSHPVGASSKKTLLVSDSTRRKLVEFYSDDYEMIQEIERIKPLRTLRAFIRKNKFF